MKQSIIQFKDMLIEEQQQLEEMLQYSMHTRAELFAVIKPDWEIEKEIIETKHLINECNQLIMCVDGAISCEDISEIAERFDFVRKRLKHCLRVDMNIIK
jgi:hypothetical protein